MKFFVLDQDITDMTAGVLQQAVVFGRQDISILQKTYKKVNQAALSRLVRSMHW